MTLNILKGKKGQEEIAGFLLVIIMIIIIGLALLFFSKPKTVETKGYQVENLLYSILATSFNGLTLSDRIQSCEQGNECDKLGTGITDIRGAVFTKSGLVVGQNLRGYAFNISGGVTYFVQEGNMTSTSRGAATVVNDNLVRLVFYY